MAVVVGPERGVPGGANSGNQSGLPGLPKFQCDPDDGQAAATILITLGSMGIGANLALMIVLMLKRPLRR